MKSAETRHQNNNVDTKDAIHYLGIVEPLVIGTTATTSSFVSIYAKGGANHFCDVISSRMGFFLIRCSTPPSQGDQLTFSDVETQSNGAVTQSAMSFEGYNTATQKTVGTSSAVSSSLRQVRNSLAQLYSQINTTAATLPKVTVAQQPMAEASRLNSQRFSEQTQRITGLASKIGGLVRPRSSSSACNLTISAFCNHSIARFFIHFLSQ